VSLLEEAAFVEERPVNVLACHEVVVDVLPCLDRVDEDIPDNDFWCARIWERFLVCVGARLGMEGASSPFDGAPK